MLGISGTRRPGCQELWWRKLVKCQLEFSWTTGPSSGGTKTEEPATSVPSNVTPVVLFGRDAKPPTPGVDDQLEVPKSPQAAPTQTPVKQVHRGHALCGEGPDLDT